MPFRAGALPARRSTTPALEELADWLQSGHVESVTMESTHGNCIPLYELLEKTRMAIMRALVGGERDPMRLAVLRNGRCRKTAERFAAHLTGTWREERLYKPEGASALYDDV